MNNNPNSKISQYFDEGGLSKSHISPQGEIFRPGQRNWEAKKRKYFSVLGNLANLTVWRKSSLVRVQRDFRTGGQLGGGSRGRISGFSENSRRRLSYRMARIERGGLPVLVTLTYPDCYFSKLGDFANWKRDIDNLGKRMLRAFNKTGMVWKMEVIDRKSGLHKGVEFPHFHCLVWGVNVSDMLKFIPGAWFEVVATGDIRHLKAGTRVEAVRSENGVRSYVSKYICKVFEGKTRYMGRWWGWIGKKNLPFAVAECVRLCDFEAEVLICAMVKRMSIPDRHYNSLFFMCDADQMRNGWEEILYEGYLSWEDANNSAVQDLPIQENL